MEESEYLEGRLGNQINWYDNKSQFNQKRFKTIRLVEIIMACTLPLLAGMPGAFAPYSSWLIGLFGVSIAILTSALSLYKYEQNWIEYRTTCETLRHEQYLYLTKTEPYQDDDAFNRLVLRTEALISKENSQWAQYVKSPKKEKK